MKRRLTNDQVAAARTAAADGATTRALAAEYGVSHGAIANLLCGATYADTPGPLRPIRRRQGSERDDAKLTESAVVEIRALYRDRPWTRDDPGGWSAAALAGAHGVSRSVIRGILAGTKWRHVGCPVRRHGEKSDYRACVVRRHG